MIALKIPMEAIEAPVAPTPAAPFQPAVASPPAGGPVVQENVFSQLTKEFDEEEDNLG